MAVKLRLVRTGKRKQPTYRLVAADSRSPRNGRFIEIIGTYEPRQEPSRINIDNDRAIHWLRNGAKPTERVEKLLRISGAWEEFTGKPLEPVEYKTKEEASVEDSVAEEAPAEEVEDSVAEEAPAEEVEDSVAEEAPAEEVEDSVAEEAPAEEVEDSVAEEEESEKS